MYNKFLNIILFLITLSTFFLYSCKPSEKLAKFHTHKIKSRILYHNILSRQIKYNNLSLKFSANYSDRATKFSFKGNLIIIHDTLIWISVNSILGIEIARIKFSPDSIFFINRIEKTYFKDSYENINHIYNTNFNYQIFQAILTNNLFIYTQKSKMKIKDIKHFYTSRDTNYYYLQSVKQKELQKKKKRKKTSSELIQKISIAPEIYKIKKIEIYDKKNTVNLVLDYSGFTHLDKFLFPENIYFSLNNYKFNFSFEIQYNKIKINKEKIKTVFKIPQKYKRVYLKK